MKSLLIVVLLAASLFLGASLARASSYQTVLATIVDPIQNVQGGPHPYSGPDLEPFAGAASAHLSFAVLRLMTFWI